MGTCIVVNAQTFTRNNNNNNNIQIIIKEQTLQSPILILMPNLPQSNERFVYILWFGSNLGIFCMACVPIWEENYAYAPLNDE